MNDRGSITLWTLGLTVMVLFLGGVSLDLWRAFEVRQDLAAMADSAATVGAAQIDADAYRDTGSILLNEAAAEVAADAQLDAQQDSARITGRDISATGPVLTVTLQGEVEFTLLRIFLGGGRIAVQATGSAEALPAP